MIYGFFFWIYIFRYRQHGRQLIPSYPPTKTSPNRYNYSNYKKQSRHKPLRKSLLDSRFYFLTNKYLYMTLGTPENPLAIPSYTPPPETRPAIAAMPALRPLQPANNKPAPHFEEWTMWKTDGNGGYIQVKEGEPLTSNTYIAKGGRLVPLEHPDDSIRVVPNRWIEWVTAKIKALLRPAA